MFTCKYPPIPAHHGSMAHSLMPGLLTLAVQVADHFFLDAKAAMLPAFVWVVDDYLSLQRAVQVCPAVPPPVGPWGPCQFSHAELCLDI